MQTASYAPRPAEHACWTSEVMRAVQSDDLPAFTAMVEVARAMRMGAPLVCCERLPHPRVSLFDVALEAGAGDVAAFLVDEAERQWEEGGVWWLFGRAVPHGGEEVPRQPVSPRTPLATADEHLTLATLRQFFGTTWTRAAEVRPAPVAVTPHQSSVHFISELTNS